MKASALLAAAMAVATGVAAAAPVHPAAQLSAPPVSMAQVQLSFAPVVKRVAPAVVNVYTRSVVQAPVNPFLNDPFFRQFFGNGLSRERVQQSLGSGVIVRSDGTIMTNNHVVQGGSDIVVALADKREFKAKLLLSDPRTDLAILKIDAHGETLPTLPFADSDKVQVGDLVLAVGDPFGVGQTVTMGIVSALARTQVSASDYQFFIQTDAAINPGNSGGALVTTDGRLAGINTSIVSNSGGSVGIGFAIPSNMVRRVLEGSGSGGLRFAWFGADGQTVTNEIARSIGLARPGGVLLKSVYPGGPAAQAGLKVGEVVLDVDGVPVDDMQALNYRIATHRPGDVSTMKVSANGQVRDIAVKLSLPPETPRMVTTIGGRNPLTGARVENLSPAAALDLQLEPTASGVAVVNPGLSIAANQGFQAGDIVRSINGQPVHNVAELQRALVQANGHWDMIIERGSQRLTLNVDG
ncbi:MAG: Do family serine endopeptidase [Alphaproteobacteria bacterium]|nr:Do family serine endopeptidase [Alphaproteobacteria bacterium]MBV9695184.1 Do family serine endopeptidase [Alphaproteobacteria bacterium]